MGRISLYLIGVYGILGAFVVYMNRRETQRRLSVRHLAEQLQTAWADHHTVA